METYSSLSIDNLTPLRTWVGLSAVPRIRWTFWARRRGMAGCARNGSTRAGSVGCARGGMAWSMSATDDLHWVVGGSAARGIGGGEEDDDHRGNESDHVLAGVFAHEQTFGFDEAF